MILFYFLFFVSLNVQVVLPQLAQLLPIKTYSHGATATTTSSHNGLHSYQWECSHQKQFCRSHCRVVWISLNVDTCTKIPSMLLECIIYNFKLPVFVLSWKELLNIKFAWYVNKYHSCLLPYFMLRKIQWNLIFTTTLFGPSSPSTIRQLMCMSH